MAVINPEPKRNWLAAVGEVLFRQAWALLLVAFVVFMILEASRSHHDNVIEDCQAIAKKQHIDPAPCGLTTGDRWELARQKQAAERHAEAEKMLGVQDGR